MSEDPQELNNPTIEGEIVAEPQVPDVAPEPNTQPDENQPQADADIITVRSDETGDKVYALREKKRYWIKNPETLAKMGFYLGKEKKIPFSELLQYPEGEPIDLTVPDALYPWDKPETPKTPEPDKPYRIWN